MSSGGFGSYGIPGPTDIYQSIEGTIGWGSFYGGFVWQYAVIDSACTDAGNTPTTFLRPGLLLGLVTSSNTYKAYGANNTDGTEVAQGILTIDLDMLDPYSNADASRVAAILCGGPVKSNTIIGLDNFARSQMRGRFIFDDDLPNIRQWWPYQKIQTKAANYTVVAADNGTLFVVNGGTGTTFTLPAIANGLFFGFLNEVGHNMEISSAEGSNVVSDNSITSSNITFSTASHLIGASCDVWSIYDGTNLLWMNRQTGLYTSVETIS